MFIAFFRAMFSIDMIERSDKLIFSVKAYGKVTISISTTSTKTYDKRTLTSNNKNIDVTAQVRPKSTASRYCPLRPITYRRQLHSFKTRLLGRGFCTLVRNLTIHPPWRPASSLIHRPVSGSDTICNSPSPPLEF